MGVPAGATLDKAARHRAVATEEVLICPRPHMVEPWLAIGSRRSFVEDPGLGFRAILNGALEDPVGAPAFLLLGLDGHEVDLWADRAEHNAPQEGRAALES